MIERARSNRRVRGLSLGLWAGSWAGLWLGLLLPLAMLAVPLAAPDHARAEAPDMPWDASQPEDLVIKLVTFGPGSDVYNYFGHNAIIVQDTAQGEARLYNFGMFHFGPEMLPNYLKGKLTFWVGQDAVTPTFEHYMDMNRSVRVQELNLSPEARKGIANALQLRVLPKNRYYLYDHFFDNCSTRLRDLIDQGIGGQFKQALSKPARMTFRQHVRRYAQQDPFIDFVLIFWMNDMMERPLKQWDELFLPAELETQVAHMQYVDARGHHLPLVAESYTVFEARRTPTPELPPTSWPLRLLLGIALGGLAWLTAQWMLRARGSLARRLFGAQHALIGLLFGLPGLLGALMWAFTEHKVTYHNENLLLANPITFAVLPLGIAIALGSQRALTWSRFAFYALSATTGLLVLCKLLPGFDQDVSIPFCLIAPINVGYALAHRALARRAAGPQAVAAVSGSAVTSS